jgi:hypothetical protein
LSEIPSRPMVARGMFVLLVVALVSLSLLAAACGTSPVPTTTGTGPDTTVVTDGSTTTTIPGQLTELDKEMAKTARAQNSLTAVLQEKKIPSSDPWFGIGFALHARAQAIGCLQMLNKGDAASLKIADGVMLDIYHLLNLARDVATGTAAQTIASARAIADKIGAPTDHVDEAKDLLNQFITASAPILNELEGVYTKMIADDPTYAKAYVDLVNMLVERGDVAGASALLDKGIAATSGQDKADLQQLKDHLSSVSTTTT